MASRQSSTLLVAIAMVTETKSFNSLKVLGYPKLSRMSLIDLSESEEGVVEYVAGGRGLTMRLISLGIVPGVKVKVVRRGPVGGPILLKVNTSEVAIGRGMAARIYVTPVRREG